MQQAKTGPSTRLGERASKRSVWNSWILITLITCIRTIPTITCFPLLARSGTGQLASPKQTANKPNSERTVELSSKDAAAPPVLSEDFPYVKAVTFTAERITYYLFSDFRYLFG